MVTRPSPEQQKALNTLHKRVENDLTQGKRPDKIVNYLIKQGLTEEKSIEIVKNVQYYTGNRAPWPEQRPGVSRQHFGQMLSGALMILFAIALSVGLYVLAVKLGASTFVISTGLFIAGVVNFFRGLFGWLKNL
jgi:hypothetical protein